MTAEVESPSGAGVPSAAACAQAAAWIARLHGEDRTSQLEAGFQRWLAASAEHRAAFEMANDIWAAAERGPKSAAKSGLAPTRRARRFALAPAPLAVAASVVALLVGSVLYFRDPGLSTAVGEQRSVMLEDGTRVTLNTATRLHVEYDRDMRRIILDHGEALFEVSPHPQWPFVVVADGQKVQALGTEFLVRSDDQQLAIMLLEGKVAVSSGAPSPETAPGRMQSTSAGKDTMLEQASPTQGAGRVFALSPGERLTFTKNKSPALDRPPLEKVIAWERGHLIFDHTPLGEAVREMNRYSDTEIKIEKTATESTQVTGIFRTGESENFARAIAEAYQLRLVSQSGTLILIGTPREQTR
jgi:transmembrane sensor